MTPVLTLAEATRHPHSVARGTYVEVDGIAQPGPALVGLVLGLEHGPWRHGINVDLKTREFKC